LRERSPPHRFQSLPVAHKRCHFVAHLSLALILAAARLKPYEKLCQNSRFVSDGFDLRNCVRGRSARLQEERQGLSDE
jgi:hypothetical protein